MCKSAWARHVCLSVLVFSSLASLASAAPAPQRTGTAKTMDEVVDRVIANENRLNTQISQYSPLVETYIQNLKPDPNLGYTPAGDKYFLGRAQFTKGVELVSLSDSGGKGKKIFTGIGNFFSFAMQYLPDGFLQMIFMDTNGFDKQHYKFDYVRREFLGEVRCLVFDVTPAKKPARAASSDASGWKIRITTSCASTALTAAADTPAGISTSIAGAPTRSPACGCLPSFIAKKRAALRARQETRLQGSDASVGLQPRPRRARAGADQDPRRNSRHRRKQKRQRSFSRAGAAFVGPPGGRQRH